MADDFVASPGSPRIYELIQDAPGKNNKDRPGGDNSVWAWPEVTEFLKIAGQPVPGPWPPHQQKRPDPSITSAEPTAVAEPDQQLRDIARKRGDASDYAPRRRGAPGGEEEASPTSGTTEWDPKKSYQRVRDAGSNIWRDTGSVWRGGSLKDLKPGE